MEAKDLKKIEKILVRALRYVCNDFTSSYASLRRKPKRLLTCTKRPKQITIEVYKTHNNIGRFIWENFLTRLIIRIIQRLNSFRSKYFDTGSCGWNCFSYQSAKEWNGMTLRLSYFDKKHGTLV